MCLSICRFASKIQWLEMIDSIHKTIVLIYSCRSLKQNVIFLKNHKFLLDVKFQFSMKAKTQLTMQIVPEYGVWHFLNTGCNDNGYLL